MLHLTKKKIVMRLISLRQAVDVALTEKKLFQHLKLKTVIFRTVTDVNGNGNFFFHVLATKPQKSLTSTRSKSDKFWSPLVCWRADAKTTRPSSARHRRQSDSRIYISIFFLKQLWSNSFCHFCRAQNLLAGFEQNKKDKRNFHAYCL